MAGLAPDQTNVWTQVRAVAEFLMLGGRNRQVNWKDHLVCWTQVWTGLKGTTASAASACLFAGFFVFLFFLKQKIT